MDYTCETEEQSLIIDRLKSKSSNFIYVITILAAIGGFLFGYDTGVISGAMILLKKYFQLNDIWIELVVSVTIGVAWIVSLIAGVLTDKFGRKPVIILASFVFTAGSVMMGLSRNRFLLLGGRIVIGIGIGLSSMAVPMYIAEIAPLEIRGKLVIINSCFITGGQFAASIIDGLFSENEINGWRYMLALAGIPSFIQFFSFLCMPESPRWLISKGHNQEALSVLQKVRGSSLSAEQEFESIKTNFIEIKQELQADGSDSALMRVFHHPALRNALLVGCALQLFQQISGINTVMYYSATIIQMSGVGENSKAIWLSSAAAAVNFICTFVGLFLVERIGRRLLTIGSLTGVIFSLCVLAVGFQLADIHSPKLDFHKDIVRNTSCSGASTCAECIYFAECGYCFQRLPTGPANASCLNVNSDNIDSLNGNCTKTGGNFIWAYQWCPSGYAWLILLGLLLYLFFFAPGMGPMPWTINSEIYPLWARSTCYSIATSVNWMCNLVISMTFLTLSHAITRYGAFYLYMGFAVIGWIFFFIMLPETKGKTLEEVESLFSHPLWKDLTTCSEKKTIQYVHIRGMGHSRSYNDPDSSEEN